MTGRLPVGLLGSIFLLAGCQKNVYQPPPPPKVTVRHPLTRDVTEYMEFPGTTSAMQTVDIRARVTGYLKEIKFQDGAVVKKGQELFVIDQRPFLTKKEAAEAQLLAAKERLKAAKKKLEAVQAEERTAKINYERAEALFRKKAGSEADRDNTKGQYEIAKANVDLAKAEIKVAEANIKVAEANLTQAELNLSFTVIKAPFDGRISKRYVDVENLISADITILTTVNQYRPWIYADFSLSERDLFERILSNPKLRQAPESGKIPLQLKREGDETYLFHGHLDFADNKIQTGTGTLALRGIFSSVLPGNDSGGSSNRSKPVIADLTPGMSVRIRAPIGKIPKAILVPERAIGTGPKGLYVLVVNKDDIVEQRAVKTGPLEQDGMRVIFSGISLEDRIIVDGLLRAIPGKKVTPEGQPSS
ncbi:MAG: MexE family multidrug efflux RND transporter periplasmic adaptor subunit [Gemmatales bacterium]|nr:MAG: MexE family multidrug efflux RND transporter periplasmic adaptor subunit [Gemmatales bacterium]